MEHAEQRGDQHSARSLARAIEVTLARGPARGAASGEHPIAVTPAAGEAGAPSDDAEALRSARELLARTEPDPFMMVVGIAGLGLLVWLVYSYAL
jgi:hypothetical protein